MWDNAIEKFMFLGVQDKDKDKDKDKDEDKDKDKVLKRPITCYIFEKLGVQGYQIRRLQ